MKPTDKLRSWKSESAYDRMQCCRSVLWVHGFLTDVENRKIQNRLKKWAEDKEKKNESA